MGRIKYHISGQHRPIMAFQGIQTSIAKKPYIFVIFQGGGGVRTPCPLLWIRAWMAQTDHYTSSTSGVCTITMLKPKLVRVQRSGIDTIKYRSTPDHRYQWESDKLTATHHKREPRFQKVTTRRKLTDAHKGITNTRQKKNIKYPQKRCRI